MQYKGPQEHFWSLLNKIHKYIVKKFQIPNLRSGEVRGSEQG